MPTRAKNHFAWRSSNGKDAVAKHVDCVWVAREKMCWVEDVDCWQFFFSLWTILACLIICVILHVCFGFETAKKTNKKKQKKTAKRRQKTTAQNVKNWNGENLGNRRSLLLFRILSDNFAQVDFPGILYIYIYINMAQGPCIFKVRAGDQRQKEYFFFASISIFLRLKDPSKVKVGQCQNIDLGFVQFLHIETLDQSSLGQNNLNQSTLNQSCLGQSSVDQSTLGQGFDQGSLGQSSVSKSTLNQSSWDQTSLGLCAKKEFEAKTWMQF